MNNSVPEYRGHERCLDCQAPAVGLVTETMLLTWCEKGHVTHTGHDWDTNAEKKMRSFIYTKPNSTDGR